MMLDEDLHVEDEEDLHVQDEEDLNVQVLGDKQTNKLLCRQCDTECAVRLLSCLHSYCNDCIDRQSQDCKSPDYKSC